MKYPKLFAIILTMFIFSCSGEEKAAEQIEQAIEVVVDEEEEELKKEEIQQEIDELGLNEEEQAQIEEQIRIEEEKKKEKIAKSPLVRFAGDPDGFLVEFSDRIEEAAKDCSIDELEDYLKQCGDDPIFRSFLKDPAFEDKIYPHYDRADEVIDNCKNP